MRKEQRTVSDGDRSRIWGIYFFEFTPETKNPSAFINAVPPAEHVATFHWLFDNFHPDQDSTDQGSGLYYLALLQEAAGQRDEALANFHLVLSNTLDRSSPRWQSANAAVKRLSRPQ